MLKAVRDLADKLLGAVDTTPATPLWAEVKRVCQRLVDEPWFERVIIALIIFNAVLLGLQTDPGFNASYGVLAHRLDTLILAIFVIELFVRITALGPAFFRSGWGWFDLIVIGLSFVPSSEGLSILRALRVLRLLRLLSVVPKMRRVIGGFFAAIPGMAGVVGVLAVVFYVSAVITTSVFGAVTLQSAPSGSDPEDIATIQELFGTLSASFFTLFQLMTLEDWAGGIVKPTLNVFPNALWFFIPYIVLTSFAVLNLFIGIIVDAMQDDRDHDMEEALKAAQAAGGSRGAASAPNATMVAAETGAASTAAPSLGGGSQPSPASAAPALVNPDPLDAAISGRGSLDEDATDLLLMEIRKLRSEVRRLADDAAAR